MGALFFVIIRYFIQGNCLMYNALSDEKVFNSSCFYGDGFCISSVLFLFSVRL